MRYATVMIIIMLILGAAGTAGAEDLSTELGLSRLEIKASHSTVVKLPRAASRVSVGDAKVADVLMVNTHQLYVNAKAPGTTNITLWDKKDELLGLFEVRVVSDLTRLKEHLYKIMPHEQVEVREMQGAVVLSGRVSSQEAKTRAEAVAAAFAPKKVTNVLQVGGSQQVLLKVRFAEVSRTALKRLNFNLGFFDLSGNFAFTLLDALVSPYETQIGINTFSTKLDFSSNMNGMFGINLNNKSRFLGFLEALKENGMAKILAEPNLVASSGKKAEFLAGGEFPIPVPQKDSVTIEYKKFGVRLDFTPEILEGGRVRLAVEPEVSELDWTSAVVIESFTVPGLTTRKAKTQLELSDGQSFAIAGLFRDDISEVISKVPLLGDIPILGALFRSTEFQSKQSELVIVVTPEIVRAGVGAPPATLPGEGLREPSELGLFFMARFPEKAAKEDRPIPMSPRELEGGFGHAVVY